MPAIRSMNHGGYADERGRVGSTHAAMRHSGAYRHAASATTTSGAVAPVTVDELLRLLPGVVIPPSVMAMLLSEPYRTVLEGTIPHVTKSLTKNGAMLAAKGYNVPARFLPQAAVGPTLEELLRVVAMLYRQMLTDRYAA